MVRWSTRLLVAAAVVVAQNLTLVACAHNRLSHVLALLGFIRRDVVVNTGTILITIAAPALAFCLIRVLRKDARAISWWLVGLVVLVNLGIAWVISTFQVELEPWRWFMICLWLGLPFVAAVCGSFIPSDGGPSRLAAAPINSGNMKRYSFLALLLAVAVFGVVGVFKGRAPRHARGIALPYDAATGCPAGYSKEVAALRPSSTSNPLRWKGGEGTDWKYICVPED